MLWLYISESVSIDSIVDKYNITHVICYGRADYVEDMSKSDRYEELYNDFEYSSYKILPTADFDESVFTAEELEVLQAVLAKFGSYTGKDLADHMHKEIAYVQTADNAYIPYSLSGKVSL